MGNRAVITTKDRKIGVYLHWNGGRDTVEPLLKYCEMKGYRAPSSDDYGWARMCQVLGNFFGGTLCVGIGPYSCDKNMDPGDNGIYVIDGWQIVDRIDTYGYGIHEQMVYDFDEMLRAFDDCMPEGERLGGYLDSVEVDTTSLELGDEVWMMDTGDKWKAYPVVGFGDGVVNGSDRTGKPYVKRYCNDGSYATNPNNYVRAGKCRIKPRCWFSYAPSAPSRRRSSFAYLSERISDEYFDSHSRDRGARDYARRDRYRQPFARHTAFRNLRSDRVRRTPRPSSCEDSPCPRELLLADGHDRRRALLRCALRG